MSNSSPPGLSLGAVPLFPLPNVVLFPRAVLPLHIFEQRYKEMTADAIVSERIIAMALLKGGWEKDYYQQPPIEPVVCVGRILEHEKLPDGNYNLLLQGRLRARVLRELKSAKPYRLAELEPLQETAVMEIDLTNERHRLTMLFGDGAIGSTPVGRQIRQILSSPMCTADIADLVAFNYLENAALKQSLLEEGDVVKRVARVIAAMEEAKTIIETTSRRVLQNPSMN